MLIILERKIPNMEAFHTRIKTIPAEITKDKAKVRRNISKLFIKIVDKTFTFAEFPV